LNWLDDNLAALRTFDVIRTLDMVAEWPGLTPSDIRLYAHGRHGVYAQLAAVLDPRVRGIEVREGLGSYARFVQTFLYDNRDIKSIILRGALQYFDLTDLRKWKAASRRRATS
jgi:hypothetical protein